MLALLMTKQRNIVESKLIPAIQSDDDGRSNELRLAIMFAYDEIDHLDESIRRLACKLSQLSEE